LTAPVADCPYPGDFAPLDNGFHIRVALGEATAHQTESDVQDILLLMERTKRSAIALHLGARGGHRTGSTPARSRVFLNPSVNFVSRSMIRNQKTWMMISSAISTLVCAAYPSQIGACRRWIWPARARASIADTGHIVSAPSKAWCFLPGASPGRGGIRKISRKG